MLIVFNIIYNNDTMNRKGIAFRSFRFSPVRNEDLKIKWNQVIRSWQSVTKSHIARNENQYLIICKYINGNLVFITQW